MTSEDEAVASLKSLCGRRLIGSMNRLLPRILAWCLVACLFVQNPASAAASPCAHQLAHALPSSDSTTLQHHSHGHAHDGHAMQASSADPHAPPTVIGCDCGCDCTQACAASSAPAAHHTPAQIRIDSADRLCSTAIIAAAPQVPLAPLLRPPIAV